MNASFCPIPLSCLLGVATLVAGCTGAVDETPAHKADVGGALAERSPLGEQGLEEVQGRMHWTYRDAPYLLDQDMTYQFSALPPKGKPKRPPWPGYYWPTAYDNLNLKWGGPNSLSPAGKYATAMGLSVQSVEDAVSKHHGIDSQSHRKSCTESAECKEDAGEICAKREGNDSGYCIPTWFGICHAWAPAAIRYDEPRNAVTRGGVEFQPTDIKALLSLMHNKTSVDFVSGRCNVSNANGEVMFDEYGRPDLSSLSSAACIETNPGTLLLLVANKVGIKGESFVEDRTWDAEVWNQPIASYELLESETIDAKEANKLVGVPGEGAVTVRESGTVAKGKWQHYGPYTLGAGEKMVVTLSGTGDADLYLRAGATPTNTRYNCRPWTIGTNETCEFVAPEAGAQVFIGVKGYADSSRFDMKAVSLGEVPEAYRFNLLATDFRFIKMNLAYIAESPATMAGYLSDRVEDYTKSEDYTAVIELNSNGDVIGGEWVGESKRNHPDFLWNMREAVSTHLVAGGLIQWDDVMSLYRESIAVAEPEEPPVDSTTAAPSSPPDVNEPEEPPVDSTTAAPSSPSDVNEPEEPPVDSTTAAPSSPPGVNEPHPPPVGDA